MYLAQLRDWVARFERLGKELPHPEAARHHLVWAMMHEGIALVVLAHENGLADQDIRAEIAPVRAIQRSSPFVCRLQDWPRGYPGDFETIEYICGRRNKAQEGTIGWYIEAMTLNTPIAQQHRNMVSRQAALLGELVTRKRDSRILIVACGAAPDVRQVLPLLERSSCRLVLNDMDADALTYCRQRLLSLGDRVECVHGNVLRCCRRLADSGPFDLILCGGLCAYLTDGWMTFLLQRLMCCLSNAETGAGRLFLTNIRVGNPYRPWMEYFADWQLMERSQADLQAILEDVGLASSGASIVPDPSGLTWFVEATRPCPSFATLET
jgi:hypothetical protein